MNGKREAVNILDVFITPLTYAAVLQTISRYVETRAKGYICVAATHLIVECQHDEELKEGVNRSVYTTPDGMPLVWILQSNGRKSERIYGPTLMEKVCLTAARHQWRVFLLGGKQGQSATLKHHLELLYPGIRIVGAIDTPGKTISNKQRGRIIRDINQSRAHIVFVGLGCPHQERWMISSRPLLQVNMQIGVGAAFDFLTGASPQAPGWMRNMGAEWLFRLCTNPKRLWKRYLVTLPEFIYRYIQSIAGFPKRVV